MSRILTHFCIFRLNFGHFWAILSYFWDKRKYILNIFSMFFLQQVRRGVIPWPWPFFGQLLFLSDVLSPAVNVSFKFKSKWLGIKVCQLRRHHLLLRDIITVFYRHVTLTWPRGQRSKRGVVTANVALMELLKFDTLRKLTKCHLN